MAKRSGGLGKMSKKKRPGFGGGKKKKTPGAGIMRGTQPKKMK